MESFFDFIFGNIFIVVIIIAGIINFLNRGKQAEKEEQRKQQTPRPAPKQRQNRDRRPVRAERPVQQARQTIKTVEEKVTNTFEDQRQAQYDRLRSQYQTSGDNSHSVGIDKSKLQPIEEKVSKVNVSLDKKLTPEGLIESVIMAEVLGPPRAHNPYQNLVVKRSQNKR